jgi:hypothetical protein
LAINEGESTKLGLIKPFGISSRSVRFEAANAPPKVYPDGSKTWIRLRFASMDALLESIDLVEAHVWLILASDSKHVPACFGRKLSTGLPWFRLYKQERNDSEMTSRQPVQEEWRIQVASTTAAVKIENRPPLSSNCWLELPSFCILVPNRLHNNEGSSYVGQKSTPDSDDIGLDSFQGYLSNPIEGNADYGRAQKPKPGPFVGRGLEAPFDLILALAGVDFALNIEGGLVFVGHRTIVYPSAMQENSVQFHVFVSESGQINPFTQEYGERVRGCDTGQFRRCNASLDGPTMQRFSSGYRPFTTRLDSHSPGAADARRRDLFN